jgi:hypothetical protein
VWDKLLGYFGDSLLRKFGAAPPAEWAEAIAELNDFQVRRGFRRLTFGWKGGVPNLPDFVRLCRAIGDDAPDEGPTQHVELPAPLSQKFDGWDITANNRFWKYVTKRLTDEPRAWGAPASTQQAEATRVLVRYKNAWAQDMREGDVLDPTTGEIMRPAESYQTQTFADCMQRAESEITVFLRGKAA